jgi:SM-20-related protein
MEGHVPDSLVMEGFLDDATREHVLREMSAAGGAPAGVYGRSTESNVETRVRSARLLDVSRAVRDEIASRLGHVQGVLAAHFGLSLASFEPPQFLGYTVGDFFVAHQDGNVSLIRDDSADRRISVVIFVNPGTYEGGELLLHGAYPNLRERHIVRAHPGRLVAFRSETTHEVTPVTAGMRYTIVAWYRK